MIDHNTNIDEESTVVINDNKVNNEQSDGNVTHVSRFQLHDLPKGLKIEIL